MIIISYDSLLESQCDRNSYPLQDFQPISKSCSDLICFVVGIYVTLHRIRIYQFSVQLIHYSHCSKLNGWKTWSTGFPAYFPIWKFIVLSFTLKSLLSILLPIVHDPQPDLSNQTRSSISLLRVFLGDDWILHIVQCPPKIIRNQLLSIFSVEDLLWRQRAVAPLRRPLGSNRCPPSLHFRLCMTRSQTCQTRPEAASHGHGYFWVMAVIVSSLFYHCVTWLLLDNTRCFPRSKFFLYFFTPVIFYQGVSIETALSRYFVSSNYWVRI